MQKQVEKVRLRLETYRQGDTHVGAIYEVGTETLIARKEGGTLTHLSRELLETGFVPTSLRVERKMKQEYSTHRRGGTHE